MGSPRQIIVRVALAAGVAAALGVPAALAATSSAPSGDQTHPRVRPRTAGRHRTFELSFTLSQAPGRSGNEYTAYRAVVSAPAHARPACTPTQPAPIINGTQGQLERIALHPPAHGWCKGQYAVTVYLQRTVTCGPPILPGPEPRIPCPVTASGIEPVYPSGVVNTGETHFTVR